MPQDMEGWGDRVNLEPDKSIFLLPRLGFY